MSSRPASVSDDLKKDYVEHIEAHNTVTHDEYTRNVNAK
jgi:hypothetical protein